MAEPQHIGSHPIFGVVDQAIRKEISWTEARARLRVLLADEPDLFEGISPDALRDLVDDDDTRNRAG